MTRPVRVAIVGLGAVSAAHIEAYVAMPDVRVVAGVDVAEEPRRQFERSTRSAAFPSVEELLAGTDLDIAVVATPSPTHRGVVERLAAGGVHCLCEKPLALSLADADAMLAACEAHGVRFAYGSSYRYLPAIIHARELVMSGAVGRVRLLSETLLGGAGAAEQVMRGDVHCPPGGPGGSPMGMLDHGVHLVDVLPWIADQSIVSLDGAINAAGASETGTEWLVMRLSGGAVGQITLDDGTFPLALPNEGLWARGEGWALDGARQPAGQWTREPVDIRVHGDDGALRILPYAHELFISDRDGLRRVPIAGAPAPAQFRAQLGDLIAAIADGRPTPVPGEVGRRALERLLELELPVESPAGA
jgi:predicted dehydrogenase